MSFTAWGLVFDIFGVIILAVTLKYCFYVMPMKMIPKASFGKDNPEKSFMHYFSWFLYLLSWFLIIAGFVLQLVDELLKK